MSAELEDRQRKLGQMKNLLFHHEMKMKRESKVGPVVALPVGAFRSLCVH